MNKIYILVLGEIGKSLNRVRWVSGKPHRVSKNSLNRCIMGWDKKPTSVPADQNSFGKPLEVVTKTDENGNTTDVKFWEKGADTSDRNNTGHAWKINTDESGGRNPKTT